MSTLSDEPHYSELKAELEALRKQVQGLRAQVHERNAVHPARQRWFARPRNLWLLLIVLLLAVGLLAAAGDKALFIDPQGYVGINQTKPEARLDVNGNTRLRGDLNADGNAGVGGAIAAGNSDIYFTNPNHEHTGKGNTEGYAAIESSKGYNSLMILGRTSSDPNNPRYIGMWDKVGIGMAANDKPRAALDVRGDVIANNVVADNTWVKLHENSLGTDQDYTMPADGQTYRRFRIEMEGRITSGGSDRIIGVRPNGSSANYGPGSRHWEGHVPNVEWSHGVAMPAYPTLLPVCTSHWNRDGQLMCTGEMNTRTGMARMILSNSVFYPNGSSGNNSSMPTCIISDILTNSWRDESTAISSLTLNFNGGIFYGKVVLYGKK